MNITKNGFYKISELELSDNKIIIGDNLTVALFDDSEDLQNISVGENSTLEYFSFFSEQGKYRKHFLSNELHSKVVVKSLIYAENNKIDAVILGELAINSTQNYTDILSFAGENGEVKLDGILQINSALREVKGRLDEENIFLGESGKISGIPTLLVETNDVEASHSCKMEKISDEKLFYLRSRGVEKENAMRMMIEAKIKNLYKCLEMYDSEFYEELLERILEKIK
ncbi:SufD family Fe-S cluster assembly protein [Candidatus Gracilibacteria bacterium]|nr:SufD family Fe-S cluster assembly protein [Candidatus Gracilibacteria bacterium]